MHGAGGIRRTSCWCAWERGRGAGLGRRWRPLRRCLMRAAVYARVSTTRQAQAQTIEQQLDRLHAAAAERGWALDEQHVYRDDGYSAAPLGRPGLDRLRGHAALDHLGDVLNTPPRQLARDYLRPGLVAEQHAHHGA